MIKVEITDKELSQAASKGISDFLDIIIEKTRVAIGGELSSENMSQMSSQQITLIGYATLREELMNGGFIQLIHNGYGVFFFHNPFDVAIRQWGVDGLYRLVRNAKKLYGKHHKEIEQEMTDDEFMALYEKIPYFEDLDDEFVSHEEEWSEDIAHYVDEHLTDFITII